MAQINKILVIQTAFIGDVILATALLEKLHKRFPNACINILVRRGNESLFLGHPYLKSVLVWDKKENKYANLVKVLQVIRSEKYDVVVNTQRFAASGILTVFSNAKQKIGFNKNPLSFLFNRSIKHEIKNGTHETTRNHQLITHITDEDPAKPRLYPSDSDFEKVAKYKAKAYITISPASVWFTKQFPKEKWIELVRKIPLKYHIYLLGSTMDKKLCDEIAAEVNHPKLDVLAGELNLLQSTALMFNATMNYANDSAPLHLSSAVNAPVTAVYCSTIPDFGFGPLSTRSFIIETEKKLSCRPCGLHGKEECPEGHFNCAKTIRPEQLLKPLDIVGS